ncbi:MAG: arginine--tRNA ligase [Planctomycetes bacterium]|nr:arginine--tRNA ligase [Planctomycetota bacterium]
MTEPFSMAGEIEKLLKVSIQVIFGAEIEAPLTLQAPPDPSLGDFAFGCFPLAKLLRKAPQVIAGKLAAALRESPLFEKVLATGPYLNLIVDKPYLARTTLTAILDHPEEFGKYLRENGSSRPSVLIEYSAPNTNKPQHLGHVRNNVLGISLTRLLKAVGHRVIPVNLINDRGIHICKSMLAYDRFGNGRTPA